MERLSWVQPNPAASQEAQRGWLRGGEGGWLSPAAASAMTTPFRFALQRPWVNACRLRLYWPMC